MVKLLLKKSYRHKDLKEIKFKDLWNSQGVFTTMRVLGKPPKILFFKKHIDNLFRSLKVYKINKKNIKKNILNLIKLNINKNRNHDHLFRVAVNNKMISVSLRKRIKPKRNFTLKLIDYKRIDPEYKNLKYKKILSCLKKMDVSKSDIALYKDNKILETGTSNLLFIKKNKIYSPLNEFYKGTTIKFFLLSSFFLETAKTEDSKKLLLDNNCFPTKPVLPKTSILLLFITFYFYYSFF